MIDRPPPNAPATKPKPSSGKTPSATLVIEAYNLAEGQSEASFLRAVTGLVRIAQAHGNLDIIVIDPTPENISAAPLALNFPDIKALHLPGQSYDGQKNTAANLATTDTVVFRLFAISSG